MMMRGLFGGLVTLAFLTGVMFLVPGKPAQAQIERYSFDKAHTQILFFVSHLGFSMSEGEFLEFDGGFTFDRTEPENSEVQVTIDAGSIEMDHKKWNEHMKSADFFHVEKYPQLTFQSTDINVTGEETAEITGDLTMLGVTKPVTLDVTYNKSGKHPFSGKYVSGFSATAELKRSDFGMDYGLPGVGDTVSIRIEVEGERIEPGGDTTND